MEYRIGCTIIHQNLRVILWHSQVTDYTYRTCRSMIVKLTNMSEWERFIYWLIVKLKKRFQYFRYTWLGDGLKYPKVKSIRYPKERSINPNVTVYVADLSILKFINKVQIKPPSNICNDSYVGNMIWLSPTDLSVTFTNREQTSTSTVLCRAPTFNCIEVRLNQKSGWNIRNCVV